MLISSWGAIYSGGCALPFEKTCCTQHKMEKQSTNSYHIKFILLYLRPVWTQMLRDFPWPQCKCFFIQTQSSTENWLKLLKYIQLTMPLNMQKPVARMRYAANIRSIGRLRSPFFCTSWTTCNTEQGWWAPPAAWHSRVYATAERVEGWNTTPVHWFQRQKDFHLKRQLQTL